jgi:hypothetical protein
MNLFRSGNYERYTPYHPFTRKITEKDIGKKIMIVRPSWIHNETQYCTDIGTIYTVKGIDYLDRLETEGEKIIPSDNEGHFVLLDEVKDVRPSDAIHPMHLKKTSSFEKFSTFERVVKGERIKECANCFRQNSTLGCCEAIYCSELCKEEDFMRHRLKCKLLSPEEQHKVNEIISRRRGIILPARHLFSK